jgi:hypothetical protein
MTPFQIGRIRHAMGEGRGVHETARLLKVSAAKVSEVRRMSAAIRTGRLMLAMITLWVRLNARPC